MATLLVVDDEQDIRDLVVKRLVRDGHKVLSADGGLIALALIERHGMPDAAILDLDMPGMNGFDLLARLRALRPQLPALFLTVLWGPNVHAGVQAAAATYVAKPFSAAELATGVRWLLSTVHDLDGARE